MNVTVILNSVLYALLGTAIFCVVFVLIDKLTPYQLWQELVEKQNTALAIVVGFFALGLCLIVAAAIH